MFRRIAALVVAVIACSFMTALPANAAGGSPLNPQSYPNVTATFGRHYASDGSYYTVFPQTYSYSNTGQYIVVRHDAKLVPFLDRNRNEMLRLVLLPKETVTMVNYVYTDKSGFSVIDGSWSGKTPLPVNVTLTFNGIRHHLSLNYLYVGINNPALGQPHYCDTPTCGNM